MAWLRLEARETIHSHCCSLRNPARGDSKKRSAFPKCIFFVVSRPWGPKEFKTKGPAVVEHNSIPIVTSQG